jgi:hypothetical protein
MIGQFSKPHAGMLAAFLVAVTLPVMAKDWAEDSGGDSPPAARLSGLRLGLETRFPSSLMRITSLRLAERPALLALPKFGVFPLKPLAGVETGQRAGWSTAYDAGEVDQGAGHSTSASSGRLARLLRHITWSPVSTDPYVGPFPIGAMPIRP